MRPACWATCTGPNVASWSFRIIGDLTVSGNLYLHDNKLESLPESFGSITTTGKWSKVWLNNNPVAESLHENSYPGLSLELL